MSNVSKEAQNTLYGPYRSGMVNSRSFVGKDFLQIKWKFESNQNFKLEFTLD